LITKDGNERKRKPATAKSLERVNRPNLLATIEEYASKTKRDQMQNLLKAQLTAWIAGAELKALQKVYGWGIEEEGQEQEDEEAEFPEDEDEAFQAEMQQALEQSRSEQTAKKTAKSTPANETFFGHPTATASDFANFGFVKTSSSATASSPPRPPLSFSGSSSPLAPSFSSGSLPRLPWLHKRPTLPRQAPHRLRHHPSNRSRS
jgi:hypothetical protein